MPTRQNSTAAEEKGLNIFEKYLTLWVVLCIAGGIVLGKLAPGIAKSLDAFNALTAVHGNVIVLSGVPEVSMLIWRQ